MCRRSEKHVIEGSKYAHWIGLYLSLHLNWVLGPFVHGRLQNLQTSHFCPCHNPFEGVMSWPKMASLFSDSEAYHQQIG